MTNNISQIIDKINKENKKLFIDYEGTIASSPIFNTNQSNFEQLLFNNVFSNNTPIANIKTILDNISPDNIYIVGIIDTNIEIEQKYQWLKQYFPYIKKEHIIFISSEHKKVDVLNIYAQHFENGKNEIIFIDDKNSHLQPAIDNGYECYNANELK